MQVRLILTIFVLFFLGLLFGLLSMLIRWLLFKSTERFRPPAVPKQDGSCPQGKESLGEALKRQRIRCGMTQEFVAETLGVSRQAVSKWENDTSDPSTANLLALAKLYGVSAADLLRNLEA